MSNTDWKRCAACLESFDEVPRRRWWADCHHTYCTACIESLLRSSLVGGPFPPQCCGRIMSCWTHENLRAVLPEDLNTQIAEKQEELQSWDRTYCSVPTCSTFIKPSHISGNNATCSVCKTVTCVVCKTPSHTGECPTDEGLQEVMRQAVDSGWMSCNRCKSVVERIDGCDEMICLCGYTFCFGCGEEYEGGCMCESDSDGGGHDYSRCSECGTAYSVGCDCVNGHRDRGHEGWDIVREAGECMHCSDKMPKFLMECRDCRLRACRLCMQHKL